MKTTLIFIKSVAMIALACGLSTHAFAGEILTNGGFESGFAGWSRADALGSDGTFSIQTGTLSPVNADTVPAPPGGTNAAMSDGGAPGSHLLWQDFSVPALVGQAILSFDLYIGNRGGQFASPATLDFGINGANQQVRVDILANGAGSFSVSPADILQNVYQSQVGDPLLSGYTHLVFDVTSLVNANLGASLRLRFAEVDNLAELQAGVDNVSLITSQSSVPEPSSLLTLATGIIGMGAFLRRRK